MCFSFTRRIQACCTGEDNPLEFTLENTCIVLVGSEKIVGNMFSTNAHSWHKNWFLLIPSPCVQLWEFHKINPHLLFLSHYRWMFYHKSIFFVIELEKRLSLFVSFKYGFPHRLQKQMLCINCSCHDWH